MAQQPITISVPDELRSAIEERATVERRTFSGMTRVLLEDALTASAASEDQFVRELIETFDARQVAVEG